jgi:hypothetical protein
MYLYIGNEEKGTIRVVMIVVGNVLVGILKDI